jgi:hypothetical protein
MTALKALPAVVVLASVLGSLAAGTAESPLDRAPSPPVVRPDVAPDRGPTRTFEFPDAPAPERLRPARRGAPAIPPARPALPRRTAADAVDDALRWLPDAGRSEDEFVEDPAFSDSGGGAAAEERTEEGAGCACMLCARLDSGLKWLHWHQDPDGHWDSDGFPEQCKLNLCDGAGMADQDVAVTGLALLAFLGAGESHKHGTFKKTVRHGLRWLSQIQTEDGRFGPEVPRALVDGHAVATLAMCEAYARTGSPLFREKARRALDHLLARPPAGRAAAPLVALVLEAAEAGALPAPADRTLPPIPPGGDLDPSDPMDTWLRTIALFREAGEPYRKWNGQVRAGVVDRRRCDGDERGSWDPAGTWGGELGRVGTTALLTMVLEVHLRCATAIGVRR